MARLCDDEVVALSLPIARAYRRKCLARLRDLRDRRVERHEHVHHLGVPIERRAVQPCFRARQVVQRVGQAGGFDVLRVRADARLGDGLHAEARGDDGRAGKNARQRALRAEARRRARQYHDGQHEARQHVAPGGGQVGEQQGEGRRGDRRADSEGRQREQAVAAGGNEQSPDGEPERREPAQHDGRARQRMGDHGRAQRGQ